jgi:hypothetical protein
MINGLSQTEHFCMSEPFDDERYYSAEQDFGGVEVANFAKVLRSYCYDRYVGRFQAMAAQRRLSQSQRPKLSANEFEQLMLELGNTLAGCGEKHFLDTPKAQRVASRLLVNGLFDVDLL